MNGVITRKVLAVLLFAKRSPCMSACGYYNCLLMVSIFPGCLVRCWMVLTKYSVLLLTMTYDIWIFLSSIIIIIILVNIIIIMRKQKTRLL